MHVWKKLQWVANLGITTAQQASPLSYAPGLSGAADDHADVAGIRASEIELEVVPSSHSTQLRMRGFAHGTLETPGDVDVFQVTLEHAGLVELDVKSFAEGQAGVEVRIVDELGREVALGDSSEVLAADVSAGTYFIEVAAADNVSTGRYGIWMTMHGDLS